MNSIPIDLLLDIFSRLPPKSIARCCCVSKQWWYMLQSPDFTKLFLTRSSARPRLLFVMIGFQDGELNFFSLPQPQNSYEKLSSLVVASASVTAEFHLNLHMELKFRGHASGLFLFRHVNENEESVHMICNPSTGQCVSLPKLKEDSDKCLQSFLGFDPIEKQFKVLLMGYPYRSQMDNHRIMTLATGKMEWRKIQCPWTHDPMIFSVGICINGVLYYITEIFVTVENSDDEFSDEEPSSVIVCFDVRSEEFKFIEGKSLHWLHTKLINYKGKLGGLEWKNNGNYANVNGAIELCVLEDVEKQEWSKYVYILPDYEIVGWKWKNVSFVGVTATGEIVLSSYSFRYKPFYVFYFNPEKNTFQRVEIQGFGEYYEEGGRDAYNNMFFAFVDYVEDLTFDFKNMLYSATSSKAHLQQDRHTYESIDNFGALCLLDDDKCIKTYFDYFPYFASKLKALFKYIWYSLS